MNLRERIRSHLGAYRTFKRVVLPNGVLDRPVRDHVVAPDGGRVLDLGCGFGDYAPLVADRCEYLGIDHNESYIEKARTMNAGSRRNSSSLMSPIRSCADTVLSISS